MVLLGGLEFVAAGYILNEISKDKKEKEEEERRRKRRQDRKDHHRHDSPHPQPPQRQDLRPPQFGPPRPNSAPPPSSHPMAQMHHPPGPSQPIPGRPQHWQPATHPYPPPNPVPQPRPNMYPPSGMQPAIHSFPPPIPVPQPRPNMYPPSGMQPASHPYPPQILAPQPRPSVYPPPGVHIDMKTGRVQHNMLPPEMQPNAREVPQHDQPSVPNGGRARSTSDIPVFNPRQNAGSPSLYSEQHKNYSQPQIHPAASTYPSYPELDSETPGRYASYDIKDPRSPPPPYEERDRRY